jgi:hypothetical protein
MLQSLNSGYRQEGKRMSMRKKLLRKYGLSPGDLAAIAALFATVFLVTWFNIKMYVDASQRIKTERVNATAQTELVAQKRHQEKVVP